LQKEPAEAGAHSHLQTGDRYRRLVEKPQEVHWVGKSSIGPLTLPTEWLKDDGYLSFMWGVSSKWLKVDVCYSLGPGGEFSVSHL
jgi:hypothetical protein